MPRPDDGPVLTALDQHDAWVDQAPDEASAAADPIATFCHGLATRLTRPRWLG